MKRTKSQKEFTKNKFYTNDSDFYIEWLSTKQHIKTTNSLSNCILGRSYYRNSGDESPF